MRGKLSIYTIILKHIQRADLLYYFQLVISPGERKVMDRRKIGGLYLDQVKSYSYYFCQGFPNQTKSVKPVKPNQIIT